MPKRKECLKCGEKFELRDDSVDGDYVHDCCAACKKKALRKRAVAEGAVQRRTKARAANPLRR